MSIYLSVCVCVFFVCDFKQTVYLNLYTHTHKRNLQKRIVFLCRAPSHKNFKQFFDMDDGSSIASPRRPAAPPVTMRHLFYSLRARKLKLDDLKSAHNRASIRQVANECRIVFKYIYVCCSRVHTLVIYLIIA